MSIFKDLLHLIFPNTCAGCGKSLVRGETEICLSCLADIEETGFHLSPNNNELFFRFAGKVPLQGAAALYYFDKGGKLQKIIAELKYFHQRKLGMFLGEWYGNQLRESDFVRDITSIVPVPLHPKREASRGFNQSGEIAKGLSSMLNIPVDTTSVSRALATETQTRKDKDQRYENMKEVFVVNKPLSGHVLVVDDVVTTGATIESLIRAMMLAADSPLSVSVVSIGCTRAD